MFKVSVVLLVMAICLSGNSSSISCDFFPPIDVSDGLWEIGLVDLATYNSIPNIKEGVNNVFRFLRGMNLMNLPKVSSFTLAELDSHIKTALDDSKADVKVTHGDNDFTVHVSGNKDFRSVQTVGLLIDFKDTGTLREGKTHDLSPHASVTPTKHDLTFTSTVENVNLPTGSYEIEDIEKYVRSYLPDPNITFSLRPNNNTLKVELLCSETIDFSDEHTIGTLLGFDKKILRAGKVHASDLPVDIIRVSVVQVECNVVSGSFKNGTESHVLHEFYPQVPPGYKIIEIPRTVIYLPVNVKTIHNLTVALKDQNDELVDFRNETISIRLHLRRQQ